MLRLIYGGTFDPVHDGHVAVATAAAAALAPCVLHLLPSADPPHRARPGASAAQRVDMLRLAFATHPEFLIDQRELRREGPSFMVDTLLDLRREYGERAPLALLLGADAFLGLPGWSRWRQLLDLCHLVVVQRPGHRLDALPPELAEVVDSRVATSADELRRYAAGRWLLLDLPLRPESATRARQAMHGNAPDMAGVDPAVARYIADHRLYRAPPTGVD